ncbi:MAG TPA: GNAT family protein [Galbitalea sp.]|jgi:RimJ/RimL family protein N-acetyltransferase|nr:GNAT family protein [Galbitalea sp.]
MDPNPALPYVFSDPIHTDRLTIRLMTERDVDDIHSYQSREDVCRYLLFDPRTREQVAEKVAKHAAATTLEKDGDYWQLALELPVTGGAPSRVIGDLYFTIASLANSKAEIGWSMHPDFHGNGYASEGATAVLKLAFDVLRLHRVVAELDPRNDASVALCKRLGMREEAFFVRDLWFRDDWADTGMYAILRDEWLANR